VTKAAVATKVHKALDISCHLATKVTLNGEGTIERTTQDIYLVVREVLGANVSIDPYLVKKLLRRLPANAEDVRK
jgi:hypothetical protein